MKWFLYNFLFSIGYCLMLPKFLSRMKKRGGYRAHFHERFGRYAPEVAARLREKPRLWVHAVSVGEANLAGNLIAELRRINPAESFVISTTSSTGRAVCEKLAAPDDVVIYLPLDFIPCVRRALRVINAKALILTESELWPNLLRAFARKAVKPLFLANARISDRSAPRYRALRWFFKDVLGYFTIILAQSKLDEERLVAAGADPAKIKVMGSVKFDVPKLKPEALDRARATLALADIDPERDLIILGGSTWPGEEASLIKGMRTLPSASEQNADKNVCTRFRLVVVPRHAERGEEIESELAAQGVEVLRKSRITIDGTWRNPAKPGKKVLLVDTTGELSALYHFAHIVFVGKSLPPNHGAQNMIEPAALGKPVLIGPNSENFAAVMSLFREANAIVEVKDGEELTSKISWLAANPEERAALGARAKTLVDSQRGALSRTAEALHEKLEHQEAIGS